MVLFENLCRSKSQKRQTIVRSLDFAPLNAFFLNFENCYSKWRPRKLSTSVKFVKNKKIYMSKCHCYSHSFSMVKLFQLWISFEVFLQFSSVAQSCPTLCDPMNHSTPGLPVHHQLPEFTQTHIIQVSNAIQPSHPLSSPSLPAPNPSQHQSLFQWVISSHVVAKVLEFQL